MFKAPRIMAVACTALFAVAFVSIAVETSAAASRYKRTYWNQARTQYELTSFSSSSPHYPVGTNHHFR